MREVYEEIRKSREELAQAATESIRQRRPEWDFDFGQEGWAATRRDLGHAVDFLVTQIELPEENIVEEYLEWLVGLLESLGLGKEHALEGLRALSDVAPQTLSERAAAELISVIERGIRCVRAIRK